jgi:alpha-L-fucosidase
MKSIITNNSRKFSPTDIPGYKYPIYKSEQGYPKLDNTIPSEVCDTMVSTGNWFWQPSIDVHIRSAEDIVSLLKKSNERRANYLIDVGPNRDELIPEAFVQRMKEIGVLVNTKPDR